MSESERSLRAIIEEVVERLAPIDRTPCSGGERRSRVARGAPAQDRGRGSGAGGRAFVGEFPPTATALGVVGMLGALQVLRGRRVAGVLLAAAGVAGALAGGRRACAAVSCGTEETL